MWIGGERVVGVQFTWEGERERINGGADRQTRVLSSTALHCPIQCTRITRIPWITFDPFFVYPINFPYFSVFHSYSLSRFRLCSRRIINLSNRIETLSDNNLPCMIRLMRRAHVMGSCHAQPFKFSSIQTSIQASANSSLQNETAPRRTLRACHLHPS